MTEKQHSVYDADDEPTDERYGELSLASGEVVIYDRRAPENWLQSDKTVDVQC